MRNLFSLLSGAALGAVLGLLFAPTSGKELREKIKNLIKEKMPQLEGDELEQCIDDVISKLKGENEEVVEAD